MKIIPANKVKFKTIATMDPEQVILLIISFYFMEEMELYNAWESSREYRSVRETLQMLWKRRETFELFHKEHRDNFA